MYVYHTEMCVCVCVCTRTLCVHYIYSLQVHMSTSDNSHTLYWMRLSIPKPQKYTFK